MSDPASIVRAQEFAKYESVYRIEDYRMGDRRKADAKDDLAALPCRGAYLDVGCGRGEMLAYADELGFASVHGTEIVSYLIGGRVLGGEAHALPFGDDSMDVASLFDVIEHLVPGDDEAVCREMARVATRHILLTANNAPSRSLGVELHINRRPYDEWDALFRRWFSCARVTRLGPGRFPSGRWRIDLESPP